MYIKKGKLELKKNKGKQDRMGRMDLICTALPLRPRRI
jgi:hypothetical protein